MKISKLIFLLFFLLGLTSCGENNKTEITENNSLLKLSNTNNIDTSSVDNVKQVFIDLNDLDSVFAKDICINGFCLREDINKLQWIVNKPDLIADAINEFDGSKFSIHYLNHSQFFSINQKFTGFHIVKDEAYILNNKIKIGVSDTVLKLCYPNTYYTYNAARKNKISKTFKIKIIDMPDDYLLVNTEKGIITAFSIWSNY